MAVAVLLECIHYLLLITWEAISAWSLLGVSCSACARISTASSVSRCDLMFELRQEYNQRRDVCCYVWHCDTVGQASGLCVQGTKYDSCHRTLQLHNHRSIDVWLTGLCDFVVSLVMQSNSVGESLYRLVASAMQHIICICFQTASLTVDSEVTVVLCRGRGAGEGRSCCQGWKGKEGEAEEQESQAKGKDFNPLCVWNNLLCL